MHIKIKAKAKKCYLGYPFFLHESKVKRKKPLYFKNIHRSYVHK